MSAEWWRDAVIYQIYPRSFQDSNGDGIGDLNGIRQRLGYIADLGADAIWICPFVRSPMRDFGYDVSDYTAVEPIFGTMEDFDALVKEAHQLNLRVVIDQVWNHSSDEHAWFQESRESRDNARANWYVWADAAPNGGPPNNWRAIFGGNAWTWEPRREQYYLHNFLGSQPNLNWYEPQVRAALFDVGRFWLDRGIDGFRLDVVNLYAHDRSLADNPPRPPQARRPDGAPPSDPYFELIDVGNVSRPETLEMLGELRDLVDGYPGTFLLGEICFPEDTIVVSGDYVRGTRRLHTTYNTSLIGDQPFTRQGLHRLVQRVKESIEDHRICWTFGTHDYPRLKGRWDRHRRHDEDAERRLERLLPALLICLPGSCCIYQGDELGLRQAELTREQLRDPFGIANYPLIPGRDGCRTPMPWHDEGVAAGFSDSADTWLPIPAEHLAHAVSRQTGDPRSLLNAFRQLLKWRQQEPALQENDVQLFEGVEPILMFERGRDEHALLCAFNLSPQPATVKLAGNGWRPCLESLLDGRVADGQLSLAPFGAAILERRLFRPKLHTRHEPLRGLGRCTPTPCPPPFRGRGSWCAALGRRFMERERAHTINPPSPLPLKGGRGF